MRASLTDLHVGWSPLTLAAVIAQMRALDALDVHHLVEVVGRDAVLLGAPPSSQITDYPDNQRPQLDQCALANFGTLDTVWQPSHMCEASCQ